MDEAEGQIEKAEERIQNTEEVLMEMLKLHVRLEDKLTDLEGRSRRENVRIYRVPEGAEKELKENHVQFQTLYPSRLWVRYNDSIKETVEEATTDLMSRGYTINVIKPLNSPMEQIRQLTWKKVGRQAGKGAFNAGRVSNYKEKLRAFRRSSPAPSVT